MDNTQKAAVAESTAQNVPATAQRERRRSTKEITMELAKEGKSINEIVAQTGLNKNTVQYYFCMHGLGPRNKRNKNNR